MTALAAHRQVPWHEVALFTVLAYALTWAWDGIWIVPRLGSLLASATTPTNPTIVFGNPLNHLPAMFGPMLAAVAMRLWVSHEGLRTSLGIRRRWGPYAIALFGPIVFLAVVALGMVLTGLASMPLREEPFTIVTVPLLVILLVMESVLGFGEEYGWRGYLLPRLIPLGEVRATLALGVIWALWHLPVLIAGVIMGGHSLWLVVLIDLTLVTLGSFPYTWLGERTRHSPIVAAIFHGSNNWSQQRLLTFLAFGNLLTGIAAIGFGWLVVILTVYSLRSLGAVTRHPPMPDTARSADHLG